MSVFLDYIVEIGFTQQVLPADVLIWDQGNWDEHVWGGGDLRTVWTDVTASAFAFNVKYGREALLDQFEAAQCTLGLRNFDLAFSPEFTGSMHFPDVQPMKRLRIRLSRFGITVPLFVGRIASWKTAFTPEGEREMLVEANDVNLELNELLLNETLPSELTGARINRILDAAAFEGARDVDDGTVLLPSALVEDLNGLEHLQEIVKIELGQYWTQHHALPSTAALFRNRNARAEDPASAEVQATFGGDGLLYQGLDYELAVYYIRNDVRAQAGAGPVQIQQDAASIEAFGRRLESFQSDHFITDSEANQWATEILGRERDPRPRLRSITIDARHSDPVAAAIMLRSIGDRIRVINHDLGMDREFWIEGIEHRASVSPLAHQVSYALLAAFPRCILVWDQANWDECSWG